MPKVSNFPMPAPGQHANELFEERYGSLTDPNSKASQAQFLVVRHARTKFNQLQDQVFQESKGDEEVQQTMLKEMNSNLDYADLGLVEEGV